MNNILQNIEDDTYGGRLRAVLRDMMALRSFLQTDAGERLNQFRNHRNSDDIPFSALNLAHYLALRKVDIRPLQSRLTDLGLSSLGRGEINILRNIDLVIETLKRATSFYPHETSYDPDLNWPSAREMLEKNTESILGFPTPSRNVRIMITLPPEAALKPSLVGDLMRAGMNCARINCAHDDTAAWSAMVRNIRNAEAETGRHCKVLFDLAGHKIRTGSIARGPAIVHVNMTKDLFGQIQAPAEICLYTDNGASNDTYRYNFSLPAGLGDTLQEGDQLQFIDCRGKHRSLEIVHRDLSGNWIATCRQTAYIESGCEFSQVRKSADGESRVITMITFQPFSGKPVEIRLVPGDHLLLSWNAEAGQPAQYDDGGKILRPAVIGCQPRSVIESLQPGHAVWIDDGKIGTEVISVSDAGALLRVMQADPNGTLLKEGKGLNLPETRMTLPPLSVEDLENLDFVVQHADMIGFSFVESLDDLNFLIMQLHKRQRPDLPIIAKIETNRAVKNLPEMILGTLGTHKIGVMIARGDLAVELGNVRLAEVQDEILCLCEAAHVPVIWATQVLETLAKKGGRSRPEITDAAMGARAECVMLNKGPYILQAVDVLDSILTAMQESQIKKSSRLRALSW